MKHVLVTGGAGFIGFHLIQALLANGYTVVSIDNLNDYYDPKLKASRLNVIKNHPQAANYKFIKLDLSDRDGVARLFEVNHFDIVINLGAQAGVRYSIDNPQAYVDSNLVGFANILEGCRHNKVGHLVYASSSSVYGISTKQPFSTADRVDYPISLYAATKKSNELMAHTYSHLFNIPTTGLRFFTVYGPYGRPDMAYYKFTKAILEGTPIDVYNFGEMQRDFTYIDDIIEGVIRVIELPPQSQGYANTGSKAPYSVYNIGNNKPVTLRRFITAIETACGKRAIENCMPMQPGDVPLTFADINDFTCVTGFKPSTSIEYGIGKFVEWYKNHYK